MNRSIVLCGLKHCGKSTHGRLLAARLGIGLVDTDDEILKSTAGCSCDTCRALYRQLGENGFRQLEAETLRRLADAPHNGRIVSLGGGAAGNRFIDPAVLRKLGFLVYLDLDPETMYSRIAAGGLPPFLADAPDPRAAFMERFRNHDTFYRRHADSIVPLAADDSVETASERIWNCLADAGLTEQEQTTA